MDSIIEVVRFFLFLFSSGFNYNFFIPSIYSLFLFFLSFHQLPSPFYVTFVVIWVAVVCIPISTTVSILILSRKSRKIASHLMCISIFCHTLSSKGDYLLCGNLLKTCILGLHPNVPFISVFEHRIEES